jgi:putative FmdB family regulatory protein
MPTYEYRCKACEHELEAVQAFTDDPLTVCPECGGDLRKRFGAVGITFKGSGFYKTDSRSSGSPTSTSAGGDTDRAGDSSGGDSSGGDSSAGTSSSSDSSAGTSSSSDSSAGTSSGGDGGGPSSKAPAAT